MIQLESVNKVFHLKRGNYQALSDVSLSISKAQIHGIIGQSGAGKSTLLRVINLLEKPDSGRVIVDDRDLVTLTAVELQKARQQIGMIFQHFNLINNKTVYDNIALPLKLHQVMHSDERIGELLDYVSLADKKDHFPSQLSGGQKQRVAIARALALKPKILLCDEATSALDPDSTRSILSLLRQVNQDLGITIVLVSHEMDVIKQVCSHLSIIESGKICSTQALNEVLANHQSESLFIKQLKPQLPEHISQQLSLQKSSAHLYPLVQLVFSGLQAEKPLISEISQKLAIDINLLQANIDMVAGQPLGVMNIQLLGSAESNQKALENFSAHGISVEVLGYV